MNPPLYGNEIFWVETGIIGFLLVAVMKLAGALFRSRQVIEAVQARVPGDEPGWEPRRPGGRPRGDAPRRPGRRLSGRSRLAIAAVLAVAALLIADKMHLKPSGTSPGTASPKPAVTARAPAPHPAVSSPAPRVPPATAHAVAHFLLTGGDLTAVLIIAILGLTAYGINRAVRRNR